MCTGGGGVLRGWCAILADVADAGEEAVLLQVLSFNLIIASGIGLDRSEAQLSHLSAMDAFSQRVSRNTRKVYYACIKQFAHPESIHESPE
jgi:hypothetical protein